jgi:hypothetical protein
MGQDRARRDHVDPDPLIGVVEGGDLGQPDDASFPGHVGGEVGYPGVARQGGHVDDRAAAAAQHRRDLVLHPEERAADVGGDAPVELGRSYVGQRGRPGPVGRVVEGSVQAAVFAQRRLRELAHRSLIADVGAHRECLAAIAADSFRDLVQRLKVPCAQRHRRSRRRESLGGGRSDPFACPGDHGHPSLQRQVVHDDS